MSSGRRSSGEGRGLSLTDRRRPSFGSDGGGQVAPPIGRAAAAMSRYPSPLIAAALTSADSTRSIGVVSGESDGSRSSLARASLSSSIRRNAAMLEQDDGDSSLHVALGGVEDDEAEVGVTGRKALIRPIGAAAGGGPSVRSVLAVGEPERIELRNEGSAGTGMPPRRISRTAPPPSSQGQRLGGSQRKQLEGSGGSVLADERTLHSAPPKMDRQSPPRTVPVQSRIAAVQNVTSSTSLRGSHQLETAQLPRRGRGRTPLLRRLLGGSPERRIGLALGILCFAVSSLFATFYGRGKLGLTAGVVMYKNTIGAKGAVEDGLLRDTAGTSSSLPVHSSVALPPAIEDGYSDISDAVESASGKELVVFWQIPRAGGNVIRVILGQCLGLVEASDLATFQMEEAVSAVSFSLLP